ncbi:MAG: hypothetical protein AABZ77_00905, partial [Chloroflexota bacterium]
HRLNIAAGDQARVELSTNVSSNWTTLAIFTNQQINSWTRVQLSVGNSTATGRIRFRLVTDGSGTAGGWDIDDVGISESPTAVTLSTPVPQEVPNIDKIRLTWTPNNDISFKSYQIYRDTQAGVDLTDTLVATIDTQSIATYLDSGLLPNTKYFYKVYVLNPGYAFNGSNEVNATTRAPGGVINYPLFDNMENGVGNWVAQSPWALTRDYYHSGNTSWTDSPGLGYNNNASTSLQISVNLGAAVMPVLDFWHKYSFEQNADFGYIEVSINGGSTWSRIYFVTGGSPDWEHEQLDLSGYTGQAQVMLRFRLASDASGTADGWYIDDVSLNETTTPAISYPFSDNMDSGPGSWLSSSWGLVTPGYSTPNAWTDSPKGNYPIDTWAELVLGGVIDLRGAINPRLTFWHKYSIAVPYDGNDDEHDYGRVYVSNYYGQSGTWQELANYAGTQSEWTMVQLDLSNYVGLSAVRIKFVLDDNRDNQTYYGGDQSHQADGWYIDDIRIQNAPLDAVLAEPANVTMHSANLSWTQNTDANFARYEVYRSKSAAATRSGTLVATITNQSTTTFSDVYAVLQPDRYHYRVYVVDQLGRASPGSNDVTAIYTVPQVGYPFQDNMEAGTANWEWGLPWGRSSAFAHSGNTSWTDSPLGSYVSNANTALTTGINLSQASSPVLTFWHKFSLEQNLDYGYVEVSTNGGNTWTQLFVVSGNGEWKQEHIKLSAYAGAVIGLRFRLASDGNGITGDGWYIDDVNIGEGITSASYPFFDNMESGMGGWFYSSPWGQTTALSHSGNTSWTDSPFGSYANNADTSLWTTVDLSVASMPVLDFWQKYSFELNKDFGYIEVSINGGSTWNRIYFVTGGNDWVNEKVDLSGYTGQAQVMLRFRLVSDAAGTADGWYIDDVSINETTASINYPFFDNMDSGPGSWLSSSWGLVAPGHTTPNTWTDSPEGNYPIDTWAELVLGGVIDLRGAIKPQLTFWHKYNIAIPYDGNDDEHDYGRVYVSNYKGQSGTWQEIANYAGTQSEWVQVQLDLSAYVGLSSVRIKFVLDDNRDNQTYYGGDQSHQADGWYIDDIRIQNAPLDVVLAEPANVTMHSADLSWTQNTDANFARYEIYRAKSAAATRSGTLVATITSQSNTAFTDVYTLLQPDRYHYRVWVVDQLGRASLGSNDVTAIYTVPQVSYPFQDNMEAGTAKWEWGSPWGQTTGSAHSPVTSWSDSPVGAYADNTNAALTTNINLSQASSPILTFWHKYALEQGRDYGYVEVSTNGGNTWTQVFVVSGNAEWKWEKVNLKPYAGAVVGLRFRLASDANGITGDGWYIDDVNISEGITSASYPLFDNMDGGLGSWFYSSPWGQTTALSHSGATSWTDSPFGSYVNNTDTSLWTTINLSMAVMPVLDFWHKYSLEKNKDFGYIEVSINSGSTWNRIYFVTGGNDWVNEKVDLSGYTGQAQVMLRFRLVSDASGTADGWYIDDVSINETPFTISYPFSDDMEGGPGKWLSSSWGLVTPGYGSPNAWTDSPEGNYPIDTWAELVLGGVIDLRGTTKPQLTFWHKYSIAVPYDGNDDEHDYGLVYVSNYYGQSGTWQQLAYYAGTQSDWTRVKIDLSAYVGLSSVRIKFILDDNRDNQTYYGGDQSHQADGWYIDDIRISEADAIAPAAITNLAVSSVTSNSAALVWTAPGDDLNTGTATQYDLRYLTGTPLTEANWNTANQTTGEPVPLPSGFTQNHTIGGLTADTTYYFAIKTVDEDLNVSLLSNIASGVTLTEGVVTVRVDAPTYVLTQRDFTA